MKEYVQQINDHYQQGELGATILSALEGIGKGGEKLELDDIAAVSEFHIRGRQATRELAQLAELKPEMEVLDLGAGLGGPARTLAAENGCRVTGIELTEEFYQAAILLTQLTALENQVTFRQGDMTEMPFEENSFDVVWSQHVQMNIPDKAQLYREVHRVLKPGGRFVIYEICVGNGGTTYFPVPWASDHSISFLLQPQEMKRLLLEAGFKETMWDDTSEAAVAWYHEVIANGRSRATDAPPPVGLNLLMGKSFPEKFQNLGRNLKEDRIQVIQAIFDAV